MIRNTRRGIRGKKNKGAGGMYNGRNIHADHRASTVPSFRYVCPKCDSETLRTRPVLTYCNCTLLQAIKEGRMGNATRMVPFSEAT